jgi:superfamily I DNA/RNA helicase
MAEETVLLDEQVALLDLVKTNQHIYFDGPPGSGKTFLLAQAAREYSGLGHKILVTCFNILMAQELETMVGGRDDVDVVTWNRLLLNVAGLEDNPPGAHTPWYDTELPTVALAQLELHPHRGSFDALFIDEFQDIAANPLHRQILNFLCKDGKPESARLVFAGDNRQQIMIPQASRQDPLASAREVAPHLVHIRLQRNCRMAPTLAKGSASALRMPDPFSIHRVPDSTEGGVEVIHLELHDTIKVLTKTVRKLLETYRPHDITILSPFGLTKSVVSEIANASDSASGTLGSADAKWLRKQLVSELQPRGIRWYSIFKFKGLESDAVVITDVSLDAIDFAHQRSIDFDDTLYVGMTRAKYHCVVLDSAGYLSLKGNRDNT